MHRTKRITILTLMALWLLSISANAATIYGSLPDDAIYVKQAKAHTCTLVSATMMLRNYAFQNGYDFEKLTVSKVSEYCWSSYGLAKEFEIGSVKIVSDTGISEAEDRKLYLISQLKAHPEGFIIYNANQPHAVFMFGYRSDTDTFFCADTTGKKSLMMIPLSDTLLSGDDQDEKINRLTKIWHIQ